MSNRSIFEATSVEDLDTILDEEFGSDTDENENYSNDAVDTVEDNDTSEEVNEATTGDEETVEETTAEDNDEEDYSEFLALREQLEQERLRSQEQEQVLKRLQEGTEYQSRDEFISALMTAADKRDMEALGMDENTFKGYKELQEREARVQQAEAYIQSQQQEIEMGNIFSQIKDIGSTTGVSPELIAKRLDENQVPLDAVMNAPNREAIIKSFILQDIIDAEVAKRMEKDANRPSVDGGEFTNSKASASGNTSLDKELERELKAYAKENNLPFD